MENMGKDGKIWGNHGPSTGFGWEHIIGKSCADGGAMAAMGILIGLIMVQEYGLHRRDYKPLYYIYVYINPKLYWPVMYICEHICGKQPLLWIPSGNMARWKIAELNG